MENKKRKASHANLDTISNLFSFITGLTLNRPTINLDCEARFILLTTGKKNI